VICIFPGLDHQSQVPDDYKSRRWATPSSSGS
jgi:hypothetical protein